MLCLPFCFPGALEMAPSSGAGRNYPKFSGEASPTDHGYGSASNDQSLFIIISSEFSPLKATNISPLLKETSLIYRSLEVFKKKISN